MAVLLRGCGEDGREMEGEGCGGILSQCRILSLGHLTPFEFVRRVDRHAHLPRHRAHALAGSKTGAGSVEHGASHKGRFSVAKGFGPLGAHRVRQGFLVSRSSLTGL